MPKLRPAAFAQRSGACAHVRASGERQQRWGERQSIGGATVVEDLDDP